MYFMLFSRLGAGAAVVVLLCCNESGPPRSFSGRTRHSRATCVSRRSCQADTRHELLTSAAKRTELQVQLYSYLLPAAGHLAAPGEAAWRAPATCGCLIAASCRLERYKVGGKG